MTVASVKRLLRARHRTKPRDGYERMGSATVPALRGARGLNPRFTDGVTETRRGEVICPRSPGERVVGPGFKSTFRSHDWFVASCRAAASPLPTQPCPPPPLQEYEWAPKVNQFVTRFLLRETASQLQSLHLSLECASDCVESQAGRGRTDVGTPVAPSSPRPGRRSGRRAQKTARPDPTAPSSETSLAVASVDGGCQWTSQILRLQRLIDQLEWKSRRLELPKGEAVCKEANLLILVVQRRISVAPAGLKQFHQALRCYTDVTAAQSRCLRVSTQRLADESSFLLYEFWQDASSWSSHSRTSCSKAFQRVLVDLLRTPEILTTMLFPASWWIMNN
uniref:ABM domain-containing protein n=1 Tax=Ornithorhynchus anatinus TaxID=9258 RepID=F7DW48_ORNAN